MVRVKHMDRKAQLANAPNTVLTFAVVAIVIAIGGLVLTGIRDTLTTGSSEYNTTQKGIAGIGKWSNFLPTIAIVLVAALLIAIVVGAFVYFRR